MRPAGRVNTLPDRWLLVLALLGSLCGGAAHAEPVDDLVRQLTSDTDYKVRLSAALNLGRQHERRAVPALVTALSDEMPSIRAVSANALTQLIDRSVAAEVRAKASAVLTQLATRDPDASVRMAAGKAVAALAVVERIARPRPLRDALFINFAPVQVDPGVLGADAQAAVSATARDALLAAHDTVVVEWPGDALPSPAELKKSKVRKAFNVKVTLSDLAVRDAGKRAAVACKLKLILASYPENAMRAFYTGGAEVDSGKQPEAVEAAKSRCIKDLLMHLMKTELAPGIETTQ